MVKENRLMSNNKELDQMFGLEIQNLKKEFL